MIGERTAEQIKMEYTGSFNASLIWSSVIVTIFGRPVIISLPLISIEALKEPVYSIIESIKTTLEKTPPELSADIMEKGKC